MAIANSIDAVPGIVAIETKTASNSASITFTGLSTAYTRYRVLFDNVLPQTDNVGLLFRVSIDGGSSYLSTSIYFCSGTFSNSAGTTNQVNSGLYGAQITLNIGDGLEAGGGGANACGYIEFQATNNSSTILPVDCGMTWLEDTGSAWCTERKLGMVFPGNNINAIQFVMGSGNIVRGTFKLFGIP